MRTACTLPYGGDFPTDRPWPQTPPGKRPPLTDTLPLDRDPLTETPLDRDPLDRDPNGQRPLWTDTPWTETPILTETSLWTETSFWTENPPGQRIPQHSPPLDRDPPIDRYPLWTESQTGVKTLPCRNFAAGGNHDSQLCNNSIYIVKFVLSVYGNSLATESN